MIVGFLIFPSFVFAQSDITLAVVSVQLWPEYDQPSMLVITDFQVTENTNLPVDLTFRIPKSANLIAVATYTTNGELVNAVYDAADIKEGWQYFTITIDTATVYRFEYYQPLEFDGKQRTFDYLWDGLYSVEQFAVRVLEPLDVTSFSTQPQLPSVSKEDDLTYHAGNITQLAVGEDFSLNLAYKKIGNTLISEPQGVQPSAPVNENTQGRISLSNSLPYMIGGLGVLMVLGGFGYYWQNTRNSVVKHRRRSSPQSLVGDADTYCPQCGARAKAGDRFCRTCGARLRHQEE